MPSTDSQAVGPSTGPETFGVNEDVWTRQQHEDGRVFFFNRATGASQWHVPNDVYRTKMSGHDSQSETIAFPAISNAVLKVDCVAELPPSMYHQETVRIEIPQAPPPEVVKQDTFAPEPGILYISIVAARNLPDGDFMPGADVSDPYCTVEIVGKPQSKLSTHSCKNTLEPEWDFSGIMPGYAEGDVLLFKVWDEDSYKRQRTDTFLGKTLLSDDDFNTGEPLELRLTDVPDGARAYLTVSVTYKQP